MKPDAQFIGLVSAQVTNFGCFRDSGIVPIDDVTALIAENENGKSTFLRALAWWSDSGASFDAEDRWDGADPAMTLDLVSLVFDLNSAASAALKEAGVAKPPRRVRIVRDTSGDYRVEDEASNTKVLPTAGSTAFEVARESLANFFTLHSQVPQATQLAESIRNAEPGDGQVEIAIAQARATVLPIIQAQAQADVEPLITALQEAIPDPARVVEPSSAVEVLNPFLPQLIYFDETVDFVQDAVKYAEVAADPSAHRTMVNLARVAGIDLLDVSSKDGHTRQRISQDAQVELSTGVSKYWQTDPIIVSIQLDESQMTLTIEHKGRKQRPSRRSSGLKWQLGFFVNFRAEVQDDLAGAVLLLDEPGLHLHIKQQPKLLELFDDLSKDGCRIIYATHLSHMLSPEKPHTYRLLIADDVAPSTTRVVASIKDLPSKSDVMQPVRQVLGMGIADAIGFGGRSVIAEGWAERYVLLAMSDFCRKAGHPSLRDSTTVLPAGGSGKKMLPFAAMAVAEKAKAVVLVDDDRGGRSTITELDRVLPGAVQILRTHNEDEQTNRELEDVFSPESFVELVNASHEDVSGFKPLIVSDIDLSKPICDAIKEKFKAMKIGEFQKLRPAMELQRRNELDSPPDEATVTRFSELFDRLNEALDRA